MKEIIRTIILLFGRLVYGNKFSKVIYYHDVHLNEHSKYTDMSTPLSLLKRHVDIIRSSNYKIVNHIDQTCCQISIAFDDGFKGIYDNKDFFVKEQIQPTIFIATTLIGQPNYLSIDEIMELKKLGFNFQCHSKSHCNLSIFSIKELEDEIINSKKELELLLNTEIDSICFPQGYFSDLVLKVCEIAGYKWFFSSIPGRFNKDCKLVYRNLCQFASPLQFRLILNGGLFILKKHYNSLHYISKA